MLGVATTGSLSKVCWCANSSCYLLHAVLWWTAHHLAFKGIEHSGCSQTSQTVSRCSSIKIKCEIWIWEAALATLKSLSVAALIEVNFSIYYVFNTRKCIKKHIVTFCNFTQVSWIKILCLIGAKIFYPLCDHCAEGHEAMRRRWSHKSSSCRELFSVTKSICSNSFALCWYYTKSGVIGCNIAT